MTLKETFKKLFTIDDCNNLLHKDGGWAWRLAGNLNEDGRVVITVNGKEYTQERIIKLGKFKYIKPKTRRKKKITNKKGGK